MAILSKQNLNSYKQCLDDLNVQTKSWTQYLSDASTVLNSNIGSTFRAEYDIGKKATDNIQSVIKILQDLKTDLDKLIADGTTFYETSKKASSK